MYQWLKNKGVISAPHSVAEWVLLGANLIPIMGIVALGWDAASLLFIYWAESAIIGFYFLLKLAIGTRALAFFLVPFFTVHYGGFMFGHMAFLTMLAGGSDSGIAQAMQEYSRIDGLFAALPALGTAFWLGRFSLLPLVISHGTSFWQNFIKNEEYQQLRQVFPKNLKQADPKTRAEQEAKTGAALLFIIASPYLRIVVMHVTIIVMALPVMLLGSPAPALVFLVLLKTVIDWLTHRFMHRDSYDGAEPRGQFRNIAIAVGIVAVMLFFFHYWG